METAAIVVGALLVLSGVGVTAFWFTIKSRYTRLPRSTEQYRVRTPDGWELRLCRYRDPENTGEPVVLCHGIMANQWSFTEPEGESLVDVLSQQGFDCWAVDVRGTRSSSPPAGTLRYEAAAEDYSLVDMPAVIDFVENETGYRKVHWVGHSMGGLMLYMYLAAFGGRHIASATTLGSPPGLTHLKAPPARALLFLSGLMPRVVEFVIRCSSVFFVRFKLHNRLVPINWNNVDRRVDAAVFFNLTEFLPYPASKQLHNWITQESWTIGPDSLDVEESFPRFDAPLQLIYGARDPFTPLDAADELFAAIPGRDKRKIVLGAESGCVHDYSHVDLIFSPNGAKEVYEPVSDWMEAHRAPAGSKRTTRKRKPAAKRARPKAKKKSAASRKKKAASTKKKTATKKKPSKKKAPARKKRPARKKTSRKSAAKKKTATKTRRKSAAKRKSRPKLKRKKPATRKKR